MFNLLVTVFPLYLFMLYFFYSKRKTLFASENPEREIQLFNLFSLILLIGVLLRIINLNFNSFWIDELFSINSALKKSIHDVISECREDVHPPLYQIILFYYVKFAGSSEMAARLLSAVFGIFSLVGFFLIARLLFNPEKAVNMSLMFSIAYLPVYYSQEARSYSLLLMLTIFTNYFFLKAFIYTFVINVKKYSYTFLYVIFSVSLLLTHYYGILIIIFNAVFLVLYCLLTLSIKESVKQIFRNGVVIVFVSVLFYIIWGHVIMNQYERDFWPSMPSHNVFSSFVFFVLNPNLKNYFINNLLLNVFSILILAFFIYNFFIAIKNKSKNTDTKSESFKLLFVIMWLYIPFIISFIQSVYSNPSISFRNLIIISPAVIIMFYHITEKSLNYVLNFVQRKSGISKNIPRSAGKYSFLLSLFLSLMLFAKTYSYFTYPSKQDIRGMIEEISIDSKIFYKNPVMFSTSKVSDHLNYYFKRFDPELRITGYFPGDNIEESFIKYQNEIRDRDYLILFDLKDWDKNSKSVIDYFKSNYPLLTEKETSGFSYYIFNLKKPLL